MKRIQNRLNATNIIVLGKKKIIIKKKFNHYKSFF